MHAKIKIAALQQENAQLWQLYGVNSDLACIGRAYVELQFILW